jgi:2'-5' RNA ligase
MRSKLDRLYPRRAFFRHLSDVNIVDAPETVDSPSTLKQLSWPEEYPVGEDQQDQDSFPEMDHGHTMRIEGRIAAGWMPAFRHKVTKQIIKSPGMHDISILPEPPEDWDDGFIDSLGMFHTREETAKMMRPQNKSTYYDSLDLPKRLEAPESLKRKDEIELDWKKHNGSVPDGSLIGLEPPLDAIAELLSLPAAEMKPERMHISIAYLSEKPIDDEEIEHVKRAVEEIAKKYGSIEFELDDVESVKSKTGNAQVAMLKSEAFDDLKHDVMAALESAGIDAHPNDLPPHVTINYCLNKHASKMVYVTGDGDDIGQQVGRMSIEDDVAGLQEMDEKIQAGGQAWREFAESVGGEVIGIGGDEIRVMIPESEIERIKDTLIKYHDLTGHTMSVGVGDRLSEADKAMIIAKFNGKDVIVIWQPEMEEELEEAKEEVLSKGQEKQVKHYLASKKLSWSCKNLIILSGSKKIRIPLGGKTAQRGEVPWVAIDLDGTLAQLPPSGNGNGKNEPFTTVRPEWIPKLQDWLNRGWRVSIYSARQYDADPATVEMQIRQDLESQGVPYTDIYIGPKPPADVYIDDRAVPFDGNVDQAAEMVEYVVSSGSESASMDEKEAGGFGNSLNELNSPGTSSPMQDTPSEAYHDPNLFEDPAMHLGDVEAPYSDMINGPIAPTVDDDKKYDITRGAKMRDLIEHESAILPDPETDNENSYTDGTEDREDKSISRDPGLFGPSIGH